MDDASVIGTIVSMEPLASNLRARAKQLGISNAEAARRADLSERRYANYVSGDREPDLATLVRIAEVLEMTTDQLLSVEGDGPDISKRALLTDRLSSAAGAMQEEELELVVTQAEAIVSRRQ